MPSKSFGLAAPLRKHLVQGRHALNGEISNLFTLIDAGFSIMESLVRGGAWSSTQTYAIGDIVTLAGTAYIATAVSTNQTPPNVTYWSVISGGGGGGGVTSVTASAPLASSGGATPNLTIIPATDSVPGSMSAADKTKLDGLPSSITGTAPISVTAGAVSIVAATESVPGSMSAADKTKLDGLPSSVTGTAPISVTSGAVSIVAATESVPGSMSAADKTKLDGLPSSVTGTAPIAVSGGGVVSIVAATESVPGSMSAADKTKLDNLATTPTGSAGYVHVTSSVMDGTVSDFITVGSTNGPTATAGYLRTADPAAAVPLIAWRDSSNTHTYIGMTASANVVTVGGTIASLSSVASIQFNTGSNVGQINSNSFQLFGSNFYGWQANVNNDAILGSPIQTSDVRPRNTRIQGGQALATASTNTSGGSATLEGGDAKTNGSAGLRGSAALCLGVASPQRMVEAAEVVAGQRVVALAVAANVTSTNVPTGDLVTFHGNAATNPTSNPTGGFVTYGNAGAQTNRGSGGTVTTVSPA